MPTFKAINEPWYLHCRSRDAFLNSSFGTSREEQATFKVFNSLVQDQVEVGACLPSYMSRTFRQGGAA